ncbi:MAG TPA: MBL fold metallo-hydrolase, partial [Verrucomicrobiae bacterium]
MKTKGSIFGNLHGQVFASVLVFTVSIFAATLGAAQSDASADTIKTESGDLVIHPVNHATVVLEWNGKTIYVDPVGGAGRFTGFPKPDLILVTDVHGDHDDPATLKAVAQEKTK